MFSVLITGELTIFRHSPDFRWRVLTLFHARISAIHSLSLTSNAVKNGVVIMAVSALPSSSSNAQASARLCLSKLILLARSLGIREKTGIVSSTISSKMVGPILSLYPRHREGEFYLVDSVSIHLLTGPQNLLRMNRLYKKTDSPRRLDIIIHAITVISRNRRRSSISSPCCFSFAGTLEYLFTSSATNCTS